MYGICNIYCDSYKNRRKGAKEKENHLFTFKERRKATFPVNKLSAFIHGGEYIVRRRHEILEIVESRLEFKSDMPLEFMSREQRHEEQVIFIQ